MPLSSIPPTQLHAECLGEHGVVVDGKTLQILQALPVTAAGLPVELATTAASCQWAEDRPAVGRAAAPGACA